MIFMMVILLFQKNFKSKGLLISIAISVLAGLIILICTPVVQRIITLTQQDPTENLEGRIVLWKGTVKIIKDNFFWGTGPGTFTEVYPAYQMPGRSVLAVYAHNDYLQFISDTGIFFIPVMFWLLYFFFKSGFKKLKSKSRQTRGLTLGAMGGVFAILVHSLGDFNLHIPANIILFTVLAGTVIRFNTFNSSNKDKKHVRINRKDDHMRPLNLTEKETRDC